MSSRGIIRIITRAGVHIIKAKLPEKSLNLSVAAAEGAHRGLSRVMRFARSATAARHAHVGEKQSPGLFFFRALRALPPFRISLSSSPPAKKRPEKGVFFAGGEEEIRTLETR